ncbi:MAG: DUF805 domain-containing protein, partial [Xanthobacteraceae bacterium]
PIRILALGTLRCPLRGDNGDVDAAVFIPHPDISPLNTLCTLVLLLPSLAVTTRRLHDIGLSGW